MTDAHDKIQIVQAEPAAVIHPIVQAAIKSGATAAELRDFLELQREFEAAESLRAFTSALTALKAELPAVLCRDTLVDYKNRAGVRTTYTHTSLSGALEAVTPHLVRHGFALTWTTASDDRTVSVTAELTHVGGHMKTQTLSAPPDTSGNKNSAQAVLSTVTMLERYTALALLGIATADMLEAGETAEDAVDSKKNLYAEAAAIRAGLDVEAIEQELGRSRREWTHADLEVVRQQIRASKGEQGAR